VASWGEPGGRVPILMTERHETEGSGIGSLLLYKESKALCKGGWATKFIGLGYCPFTGYNPGLLPASLLDITSWEDIST
jgi:hypothetical protein